MALLEVMTSLLARLRLPDLDLCVAEEGPQVLRGGYQPVLAATRSHAHMDLLVPDLFFYLWETPPHLVPHPWYKPPFNLASPLVYAAEARPEGRDFQVGLAWEEREARAFWRGSVDEWAMNARGRLCRLAARRPDIFDVEPIRVVGRGGLTLLPRSPTQNLVLRARTFAWHELISLPATHAGITALHSWKDFPPAEVERFEEAIRRGGAGVPVDPVALLKYKYVINIHGNGNEWSNRFRMLLSSGALVLKQESTLFEYWERNLRPFEHYIPVKADLSDLIEKVEWARDNDDAARRIASAAVAFVREHLHLDAVQCEQFSGLCIVLILGDPRISQNVCCYATTFNLLLMTTKHPRQATGAGCSTGIADFKTSSQCCHPMPSLSRTWRQAFGFRNDDDYRRRRRRM